MAVSLGLSITQNSQNDTTNTSNVTVTLTIYWTGGSYNGYSPTGTLTIDGEDYPFTCNYNYAGVGQGAVSQSGSVVACSKTGNIVHNSDGTKTLYCSATFDSGSTVSGTVTTSASKVLTPLSGTGSGGDSGDMEEDDDFYMSVNCTVGDHSTLRILEIHGEGTTVLDTITGSDRFTLQSTYPYAYYYFDVIVDDGYEVSECTVNGTPYDPSEPYNLAWTDYTVTVSTVATETPETGGDYNYSVTAIVGDGAVIKIRAPEEYDSIVLYEFTEDGTQKILNVPYDHIDIYAEVLYPDTHEITTFAKVTIKAETPVEGQQFSLTGKSGLTATAKVKVAAGLKSTDTPTASSTVCISNGTGWDYYTIYISNGTSWDTYAAYIDNGSEWEPYS